jgi:hypothetical protein
LKSFIELDVHTGEVRTFLGDLDLPDMDVREVKRVSYIYPACLWLRIVFILLRKLFGDSGRVAEWTRRWRCLWEVRIGNQVWTGFQDRQKAIEFERAVITALIINEKE